MSARPEPAADQQCGQPTLLGGMERPCQLRPGHEDPHLLAPLPRAPEDDECFNWWER